MDTRTELLKAAAEVFSQHGFRGSTTRRIADAAGVNEVTLFRYFGSKEALLQEAIANTSNGSTATTLPETPVDPTRSSPNGAADDRAASCETLDHQEVHERDRGTAEMITTAVSTPVRAPRSVRLPAQLKVTGTHAHGFDVTAAGSCCSARFSRCDGAREMPQIYPAQAKAPGSIRDFSMQSAAGRQRSTR